MIVNVHKLKWVGPAAGTCWFVWSPGPCWTLGHCPASPYSPTNTHRVVSKQQRMTQSS